MITGIIQASGLSRRMAGHDKLLLPVDGSPLVELVMKAADASRLDAVLLIFQNSAVAELARPYRITAVYNPDAAQGQSASIKAGVLAADAQSEAYMFLTGDQPRLDSATINLLIDTWQDRKGRIIVPVYNGRRGSPTIFPASMKDNLLALVGDTGGRAVMEQAPDLVCTIDMPSPYPGLDIDTTEDYESLLHN